MGDSSLGVAAASSPTAYVDNESTTTGAGNVIRQRVSSLFPRELTSASNVSSPAATGTITAYSGQGTSGSTGLADSSFTGGAPASGSTVVVIPRTDHSSFSVFTTGTWVGTLATEVSMDGSTWIAVNTRQSYGGRLANNFSANGLFRGVIGGMYAFRVRATAWTSGTANVWIALGTPAAVFQNSDIVAQTEVQYYASSAGNNSMWGANSGEIALPNANTETPVMFLWNNDASGGRVMYVAKITKGASGQCRLRRYRSGPGQSNMTYTSGGSAVTIINHANQSATATAAKAWSGGSISVANQPSNIEKTVYFGSGGGQWETDEQGGILIPPQTGVYWTALPSTNGIYVSIECVYWDGSTLT